MNNDTLPVSHAMLAMLQAQMDRINEVARRAIRDNDRARSALRELTDAIDADHDNEIDTRTARAFCKAIEALK
jgi:hypothetical protein